MDLPRFSYVFVDDVYRLESEHKDAPEDED